VLHVRLLDPSVKGFQGEKKRGVKKQKRVLRAGRKAWRALGRRQVPALLANGGCPGGAPFPGVNSPIASIVGGFAPGKGSGEPHPQQLRGEGGPTQSCRGLAVSPARRWDREGAWDALRSSARLQPAGGSPLDPGSGKRVEHPHHPQREEALIPFCCLRAVGSAYFTYVNSVRKMW